MQKATETSARLASKSKHQNKFHFWCSFVWKSVYREAWDKPGLKLHFVNLLWEWEPFQSIGEGYGVRHWDLAPVVLFDDLGQAP